MSSENSFDIVSKMDLQELTNAVTQTEKEISTRYDFKGSKSSLKLDKDALTIVSDDETKLKAVIDVLQSKMAKRNLPLKNIDYGKVEPASSGTVRQRLSFKQGIDQDVAKKINILIRDSKMKVKSQIQGDQLRVTGKSKNDLQAVMQLLNGANLPLDLQYTNFK
ncbi:MULTISPECIES: YajQ family cyclic di-GMP-binding protein [Paenibacillus]|uniref:YajQ family cyclic di-GMP-binding protein n=1 Tax=Paenibacillus TaxID=44249 RepID=UPI00129E200C|nr:MULTISPECIES: YajQ family cyclic di-GMP-binding protein [Paenibacillus]MBE7679198.1 YajQ family cyclic di-GMP-binding protein [Paenibacillus sp. P13VS]MBY0218729.1 YajQ family cyclic di-GMP-binding protein [Paenibacillus illinoisensis]MCM3205042.1 YajQ family cyclic di-GMP-binding protein [Paenibacillus illinoisensis]WJH29989.1 YajQ family cyclic di-GMP-binding protein [Paenibacillus sp. CC-CFT742]